MGRYDHRFYDTIRDGCRTSAEAVAPLIAGIIRPASIVDVGCGEGWWGTSITLAAGVPPEMLVGIDGPGVPPSAPIRTCGTFVEHDLRTPIAVGEPFALAVCLEVAEHLPPDRAATFIDELCQLAPAVVFSAAVPGQGGTGHANCQPPGYWADLFGDHGHTVSGALRWALWDDIRVEPWYRNNLLVAAREPDRYPRLFDTPLARPWHVNHPDLWITR